MGAGPLPADLPRAEWRGVERIVIVCDAAAAVLCPAILDQARRLTRYPIVVGEGAALAARNQLTLHVAARAIGRDRLAVELRLQRFMLSHGADAAPPQRFIAARADRAALAGPLNALLNASATARRNGSGLRRAPVAPPRSD